MSRCIEIAKYEINACNKNNYNMPWQKRFSHSEASALTTSAHTKINGSSVLEAKVIVSGSRLHSEMIAISA